jgi:Zn-dependent peptidase ImmA (M78 family)
MFSSKEAIGFCCDELPGGVGYTYTLTTKLGVLLFEAETRFGQRNRDWTLLGIEFSGDVPQVWYPGNRHYISIILSDDARTNPHRALFQLAHEVIHVLAPTGGRCSLMIEEGLATFFSMEISARYQLNFFVTI